jgi:parallel beta-helix repeat protein
MAGNTANSNNSYGIHLYNSSGNTLIGNASRWNKSYGIYLYDSSGNTMTDNIASNNYLGIYLYYNCNNNEIYNNNFIDNQTQAYVYSSSGNIFNLSELVGGNYWSDWTTPDADRDGFVDNPYIFTAGQDSLPWTRQDGWTNQPPVADAGADQLAHPVEVVTLDGSGSSDVESDYPLTYSWQITSKPEGSTAVLSEPNAVNPSFTVDMLGDYIAELVVTDSLGAQSTADEVLISTYNTAPVADAGADQTIIEIGTTVELDGTQSSDPEGDEMTYFWTIMQKPAGSMAELSDPCSATPTFVADIHGDYVITLIVTDIFGAVSDADNLAVGFENVKPVADAGVNQTVIVGDTVSLDGSGSTDANFDMLIYSWSFVSVPAGSLAEIADPTSVQTSFVADEPGAYVVSLVVNDGFVDSDAANVTITAMTIHEAVVKVLVDAIGEVNDLDPEGLKNGTITSDALINKINVVLGMINDGRYENARHKLVTDLVDNINGCAETGEPDDNDWIITCEGQSQVYPLIVEAIGLLQNLI